jgi:hypothetical protein
LSQCSDLPQGPKQKGQATMNWTSETISQNKFFFLISCLSQVLCHSNPKLTNPGCGRWLYTPYPWAPYPQIQPTSDGNYPQKMNCTYTEHAQTFFLSLVSRQYNMTTIYISFIPRDISKHIGLTWGTGHLWILLSTGVLELIPWENPGMTAVRKEKHYLLDAHFWRLTNLNHMQGNTIQGQWM